MSEVHTLHSGSNISDCYPFRSNVLNDCLTVPRPHPPLSLPVLILIIMRTLVKGISETDTWNGYFSVH